MKHRDDKYDFMELGILEKFPYPITDKIDSSEEWLLKADNNTSH